MALVGYTNAGKTSLFNRLTGSQAVASTALFATLDPLMRRVRLPDRRSVLVSDTVGFIDRLPHTLVAAFRATLEELAGSDLLLHVVDASHPARERRMDAVVNVLEEDEVDAADLPRVLVFNKCDRVDEVERQRLARRYPEALFVSALTGAGRDAMIAAVTRAVEMGIVRITLDLDDTAGDDQRRLAQVYRHGRVLRQVRRDGSGVRRGRGAESYGGGVEGGSRPVRRRCLTGVAVVALAGAAACVTRVPVVAIPSYPEYLFPAVPAEYAASSEERRHEEAWTFLQAGDLMMARTRFAALLDSSPGFYPAETALGWVNLARGDHQAAVGYFDRVTTEQPRYVPALVGRGEAMLALDEAEEALRSFDAALAEDAGLGSVQRIVQKLRFTLVSEQLQVARRAAAAHRYAEARAAYERVDRRVARQRVSPNRARTSRAGAWQRRGRTLSCAAGGSAGRDGSGRLSP